MSVQAFADTPDPITLGDSLRSLRDLAREVLAEILP